MQVPSVARRVTIAPYHTMSRFDREIICRTSTPAPDGANGLVARLSGIVGKRHVLTDPRAMRRFTTGFRTGHGDALAVVRPGSLVELWRVLEHIVATDAILIMQAANTGLTGGSTPNGHYDRPVILVSTTRLDGLHLLAEGRQVICLPGSTLHQLERRLRPLGREPHSVIGSSCIGASVMGGVCNNSGGALVRRGPAYTELALYARIDEDGKLRLVNHLGIDLGADPETMLDRVARGDFSPDDIDMQPGRVASDGGYAEHVRKIDEPSPARFNADPSRLFEASGSAGKAVLFAVRLDTFPIETGTRTFYIGTNDTAELTALRRAVLGDAMPLPIAGEYMHREAFDIASVYGRDMFFAIRALGTDRLPALFAAKARFDAIADRLPFGPHQASDRLMQFASRFLPRHLPQRMRAYRDRYEHHLMLKVPADGVAPTRALIGRMFPSADGDAFECTEDEAERAFLHRFVAAGAAVRYRTAHRRDVGEIVALDIALRRDDPDWFEHLPEDIARPILKRLYYGHFLCHVLHQDYIVAKGTDPVALEERMWELLDRRGAEYPAEHNVGHLYRAKPALAAHYRNLDPTNSLNPGIGHMPKGRGWSTDAAGHGTGCAAPHR